MRLVQKSVLPGFGLTLGITVVYLSLLVLIPFAGLFSVALGLSVQDFWDTIVDPRVVASFKLTFGASFLAATINMFCGFAVAWVLVRYRFPGRRLFDAMVDLPFALPTAVTGIALGGLYDSQYGWIGQLLPFQVESTRLGVLVALTFIGLPFVVRTVQPALEDLESEYEEVAASLGATRWQTFRKVILPTVRPAVLTGFAMAFARALGEYGSVIFIAGMLPMKTEIISQLIMVKLESGNGEQACAAIAIVMLLASFSILLVINLLQMWGNRKFLVSR